MKNIIASFVTSVVILSVCEANTPAINPSYNPTAKTSAIPYSTASFKGAYVGLSLGANMTNADLLYPNPAPGGEIMAGEVTSNFGLQAGYGWVSHQVYWGGEVGHTFENIKLNNDQFSVSGGAQTLTRNGTTTIGVRIGSFPVPGTLIYGGVNAIYGKWKALDNGFSQNGVTLTGTSKSISWAPLLGVEIGVGSNVRVRAQYAYEFGPDIKATSASSNFVTEYNNIRNQTFTLGLNFKFPPLPS